MVTGGQARKEVSTPKKCYRELSPLATSIGCAPESSPRPSATRTVPAMNSSREVFTVRQGIPNHGRRPRRLQTTIDGCSFMPPAEIWVSAAGRFEPRSCHVPVMRPWGQRCKRTVAWLRCSSWHRRGFLNALVRSKPVRQHLGPSALSLRQSTRRTLRAGCQDRAQRSGRAIVSRVHAGGASRSRGASRHARDGAATGGPKL